MEKKKLINVNGLSALLLAAGLLISTTLMFSCDGKKEVDKTTEPTGSGTSKEAGAGPDFLAGIGKYAVLKLDKADVANLFNPILVRKLLLEFTDSNATAAPTKTINLVAYASKLLGDTVGSPVFLFPENIAAPQIWDTTGRQMLGNNELTKREAKIVLGISPTTRITAANAKTLYFYPIKKANNHIAYIVSTQLITNFTTMKEGITVTTAYPPGSGTNPSPPAPPCNNGNCGGD